MNGASIAQVPSRLAEAEQLEQAGQAPSTHRVGSWQSARNLSQCIEEFLHYFVKAW